MLDVEDHNRLYTENSVHDCMCVFRTSLILTAGFVCGIVTIPSQPLEGAVVWDGKTSEPPGLLAAEPQVPWEGRR